MWRGTTPMHIFTLPVGVKLIDFSAVFITYSQNGETILEKTEADLTPTETGFTVTLTQADNIDESKGTPLALVISLADMNGISQSNNAIYNASFSTNNVKANPAHIVVYQGALSVGTSTSYPTYSNGTFNLNKQLKAGWTYNYMVAYG